MEGLNPKALLVRGRSISRNKGKPSNGRSKSRGKSRSRSSSTSPVQSTRRCWTCGKLGNYKKDCKLKGVHTSKDSDMT